jgi:hypothetical protein
MRNIYTIERPTLEILGVMPYGKSETQYQIECFLASRNVYITSNEYIGLSYYLDDDLVRKGVIDDTDYWEVRKDYKKIIMTTDPKLIKDGIQAIPNEFMEWFVKNPSCEKVEIELIDTFKKTNEVYVDEITKGNYYEVNKQYKIIIPHEELKQETLEEARANSYIDFAKSNEDVSAYSFVAGWDKGAKWQQEQYEVLFNEYHEYTVDCIEVELKRPLPFKSWVKQFKNK